MVVVGGEAVTVAEVEASEDAINQVNETTEKERSKVWMLDRLNQRFSIVNVEIGRAHV